MLLSCYTESSGNTLPTIRDNLSVPTARVTLRKLYMKIQLVPRSKLTQPAVYDPTSQLMLYREIMAVCSEIHTKHKYSVWAERGIVKC